MNFTRKYIALLLVLLANVALAAPDYLTFESGPVRPLALSNDGTELYVLNIPDGYLEIFDVTGDLPIQTGSVPVGLDPVSLAVHGSGDVWVVNHVSDSVSVVDVDARVVRRTLLVGDEPRDIVFAGTGGNRAFITTAHRGQHRGHSSVAAIPGGGAPLLSTAGEARADVWVFDATNLGSSLGGTPVRIVRLFGDTPRALAVSPDGNTVYAAIHFSGNQTTTIHENLVCDNFGGPCSMLGESIPGGNPGPATNFQGIPAPEVGLIVRYNNSNNRWEDELNRNWTNIVKFNLPDFDVFAINANTLAETNNFAHVGTILYNMAVNPTNGKVYVSNSEARNEVRFEGPGTYVTNTNAKPAGEPPTVQGHLHEMRITVLDGNQVLPRHLNKHINYNQLPAPANTKQHSLSMPLQMQVSADGATLYVAAFGSSKVGVFSTATLENDSFNPVTQSANYINLTSGGTSGLALDESRNRLYVLNRFDNSLSTVDLGSRKEIAKHKMFNPEPPQVVQGRPFLYDAVETSSNGEASCATCHIFGDMDHLAWDLGDPDGTVINNPVPIKFDAETNEPGLNGTGNNHDLSPMKGPMTTQTLKGMVNHGAMHWRGDRTGGNDPGGDPMDSNAAFLKFNVAFEGLIGRDGEIADEDMQKFADFMMETTLPPNPNKALNNVLSPSAAVALSNFDRFRADGAPAPATGFTCEDCHRLQSNNGFFGTNGEGSFEDETQIMKIPHLRNMYQKVGMFGMGRTNFINDFDNGQKGNQVRGFGFLHDGSVDTLFRFFNARVFDDQGNGVGLPAGTTRNEVVSFMLEFDNDIAPIVGQQITRDSNSGSDVDARIDLLIAGSNRPFRSKFVGGLVTECDVVVHGLINNEHRSWRHTQNLNFEGDDGVFINAVTLRNLSNTPGNWLTYTCAPPGSGIRAGVDRDRDALKNGLDNCPGRANPDQADLDDDGVGNFCDPDFENLGGVISLPDLDGNSVPEAAGLWLANNGAIDVQVNDPQSGALLRQIPYLSKTWKPIEAMALENMSSGSGTGVAVLAEQINDGLPIVQVKDAANGNLLKNVFPWSAAWQVQDLDVISGGGNNGNDALAILATRRSDGLMGVELRDPVDGTRIRIVYPLGFGWTAKQLAIANVNGNAAIAVLAFRDSDNLAIVQVRNATNSNLIRNVFPLGLGWSSQELHVLPDANGDSVDEIAVRMTRDLDGLELIQIRSAQTNALIKNVYPIGAGGGGWTTRSFQAINNNGTPALGILSTRDSDKQMLVQLKNATTGGVIRNIFFLGPPWGPVAYGDLPDFNGDNISEHGVLTRNRLNQSRLIQVRNGGNGAVIRNLAQF